MPHFIENGRRRPMRTSAALAALILIPMANVAASPIASQITISLASPTAIAGIPLVLSARTLSRQGIYAPTSTPEVWSVSPTRGVQLSPKRGPMSRFEASIPGRYRVSVRSGKLEADVAIRVAFNAPPRKTSWVTLDLRAPTTANGLRQQLGTPSIPRGMPQALAAKAQSVPLYPKATPRSVHLSQYPAPIPMSWYLAASSLRAFTVRGQRSRILSWYERAFSANGFIQVGSSVDPRHHWAQYSYSPKTAPNSLMVTVQFTSMAPGLTQIVYAATAIRVPRRPRSSLVSPKQVKRLAIVYRKAHRPTVRFVLQSASAIRPLVRAINQMSLASGIPLSCPQYLTKNGTTATISGPHFPTVYLLEQCGALSHMGHLLLQNGQALSVIQAFVAKQERAHRPRS